MRGRDEDAVGAQAGAGDALEDRLGHRVRDAAEVDLHERELPRRRLEHERPRLHPRVDPAARDERLRVQAGVGVGDDLEAEVRRVLGVGDAGARGVGEHRRADRRREVGRRRGADLRRDRVGRAAGGEVAAQGAPRADGRAGQRRVAPRRALEAGRAGDHRQAGEPAVPDRAPARARQAEPHRARAAQPDGALAREADGRGTHGPHGRREDDARAAAARHPDAQRAAVQQRRLARVEDPDGERRRGGAGALGCPGRGAGRRGEREGGHDRGERSPGDTHPSHGAGP